MFSPVLRAIIDGWRLPDGGPLLPRIEAMIRPALISGHFGSSATLIVGGIQYHLGGERDTRELANLVSLTARDDVLDVCCFLGGPAIQLAQSFECRVTGIDISQAFVAAASQIARLSGLDHLVRFCAGDAASLPFQNERFTVVWSQCCLEHDQAWLRELDRVLAPGGRLALTFAIRRGNPNESSPPWTLQDVMGLVHGLGYRIDHAQDITERDIEIGWKALDRELTQQETDFTAVLGKDWVRRAHQRFAAEIRTMCEGRWGNGRIVATQGRAGDVVASAAPPQPGTAPSAQASGPLDQAALGSAHSHRSPSREHSRKPAHGGRALSFARGRARAQASKWPTGPFWHPSGDMRPFTTGCQRPFTMGCTPLLQSEHSDQVVLVLLQLGGQQP